MSDLPHPVIAVDGTAASGKSTFSRELARRLGYVYVNTGAMYRGVTWYLQQRNVPLQDGEAVARVVEAAGIETRLRDGELVFHIAGLDPLPYMREASVNEGVSVVAQVPAVRKLLVAEQQRMAALGPLVMEGRDIGTVVFPTTPYKFYIDANPEVRAQRRKQQGETDVIQKRDTLDQQRVTSPLTRAANAFFLDSGRSTVEELIAIALRHVATLGLKTVLPLWNGPVPLSHGSTPDDIPTLTVYLPKKTTTPTAAVIVCPGGAYEFLAFDYEGLFEAEWFQKQGVAGLVLKYRLPSHGYRHPVPLLDAQRAIRLVRSLAAEWNIDPAKVGILGFSAGGHLASTLETHFDAGDAQATDPVDRQGCRPDFAVLAYAVISMKDGITHAGCRKNLLGPNPDPALIENLSNETQVTAQTPPTLLVHAENDKTVPIEHSMLMLAALQRAGVPSALHEYPEGGHGFGYHPDQPGVNDGWLDKACDWLKGQGFLP